MTKWISIKDRFPTKEEVSKHCGWVLVFREMNGRPDISRYDGYEDDRSYEHGWKYPYDISITHWMPLPENPND